MKRWFIFFLFIINYGEARLGCRDNSWYLQKKYDYKQDHAVSCFCPCPETMNRCPKCQHYHEAKPWTIIKKENNKALPPQSSLFNQNMQSTVKRLLLKHQLKKNSSHN